MKISEIYKKYQIPPWLQMHMYRVTAVAATLFDAHRLKDGRDELISAGLLHDMGNIAKFNFETPVTPIPEGEIKYWEEVKKSVISKYSVSAHIATLAMIDEIGARPRVREIIDSINFSKCDEIQKLDDMSIKILQYADMRVIPSGIDSLQARFDDMYIRYAYKRKVDDVRTSELVQAMKNIEKDLFEGISLEPSDISENSLAKLRDSFSTFEI
jgi:predicted HD phosphohydrolase